MNNTAARPIFSQIESLAPLDRLHSLGYLGLVGSRVSLPQLLLLRGVHILELAVGLFGDHGCSVAVPGLSSAQCRLLLVRCLQRGPTLLPPLLCVLAPWIVVLRIQYCAGGQVVNCMHVVLQW